MRVHVREYKNKETTSGDGIMRFKLFFPVYQSETNKQKKKAIRNKTKENNIKGVQGIEGQ